MGAKKFDRIATVTFNSGECAIEIGTDRGEGSTQYLRTWCEGHSIPFFSVDIDPHPYVMDQVYIADGTEWLLSFTGVIKFAYLDNYDYVWPEIANADFVKDQIAAYARRSIVMTNEGSELAHLTQSICVHNRSVAGSLIIIDDTWRGAHCYQGKGALAVPWLITNGWQLDEIGDNPSSAAVMRRLV